MWRAFISRASSNSELQMISVGLRRSNNFSLETISFNANRTCINISIWLGFENFRLKRLIWYHNSPKWSNDIYLIKSIPVLLKPNNIRWFFGQIAMQLWVLCKHSWRLILGWSIRILGFFFIFGGVRILPNIVHGLRSCIVGFHCILCCRVSL